MFALLLQKNNIVWFVERKQDAANLLIERAMRSIWPPIIHESI